jgi:AcrR family transcriptional regulator
VRDIAWRADTNSRAVLNYFGSHGDLVVYYLEQQTGDEELFRVEIETDYPGDPDKQLLAWIKAIARAATDPLSQGCALTSAAIELMLHKHHPAHRVIKKYKTAQRDRLKRLCHAAGYDRAEALADKLFMLAEGGDIAALTIGANGPGIHFEDAAQALLLSHPKTKLASTNTSGVSHA